jgi:hypothetical protein
MPEMYELGPDDFCRACRGEGCLMCDGKGHHVHAIDRDFFGSGPVAVCVHDCQVIGHRVRVGASEECGCPEEDWIIHNIEVTIHFEPDGSGDILADAGDWDIQLRVPPPVTMDELRMTMFNYITGLPLE